MEKERTAPGLHIVHTNDDVVLRIERQHAAPILSILLHSKFSDGPRTEFLTTPYVNALISALLEPAGLMPDDLIIGRVDLDAPIQLIEKWAASQGIEADEANALLREATYPYTLK